ncbi:UPF0182 family protein, partial [Geminocystis sp. GBBB08]|uniref:UPF0182 family protein n=1 Tax=Geminocystis sp. GBBB08 TaxID=2604140 RepID=UPI0027E25413
MKVTKKLPSIEKKNNYNLIFIIIILLILLILSIIIISNIYVNILWFQEVNYLKTFYNASLTKLFLWMTTFCISISFLWGNLVIAEKQKKQQLSFITTDKLSINKQSPQSPELKLKYLFPIIFSFSLLICIS